MAEKNEKQTSSSKVNGFLEKHKKLLVAVLIAVFVCLIGYIVISAVSTKLKEKYFGEIDEISYTLTNESSGLEEAELENRRVAAIENLQVYAKKGGIVGARANYLCGELSYQQKKYEDAINYYKATAQKAKKTYLEPVAYYNVASCYEELNNLEEACANYKIAAEYKDFPLKPHAKFSYARTLEESGKIEDAVKAYTDLYDSYPSDNWGKLAKTKLITLKAQGKTE